MYILIGILGVLLVIGLLAALLYWLLITTEGVYLGRGVVIKLYDWYASRYDRTKSYNPTYEQHFLAQPLMQRIAPNDAPLVLDVATGTARLPIALLCHPRFEGMIVAVDLSRRMLHHAVHTIAEPMYYGHVHLMHAPAEKLPFPDHTFDVVTCLEALEFMVSPRATLREIIRVTRPGGQLLLTNRAGSTAKVMPGKAWSREEAQHIYQDEFDLQGVDIVQWQVDYDLVWARKAGSSLPTRRRPLEEIWQCPACATSAMLAVGHEAYVCENCEKRVQVGKDGVIDLFAAM